MEVNSDVLNSVQKNKETLCFDFSNLRTINSFEIVELFLYVLSIDYADYQIKEKGEFFAKLESVNFFQELEKIKKSKSNAGGTKKKFYKLQSYVYKADFYSSCEDIITLLINSGFEEDLALLLLSSLGELVDNSFFHNLGKWSTELGPLVFLLMQNLPEKKEFNISVADLGIGFLETLKRNYPEVSSEEEAIKLALKENTTGRIEKRGGNGLLFLQNNIFNGFKGSLLIRSRDTLVAVKKHEEVKLLKNNLPFRNSTNIFINLKY